jgi:hypothetical protein
VNSQPLNHPISLFLSASVPLRITALVAQGGPTAQDFEALGGADKVMERADELLLYRGKKTKPGEIATAFNQVAQAIAVMSFVPGGITIFNQHYDGGRWPIMQPEQELSQDAPDLAEC